MQDKGDKCGNVDNILEAPPVTVTLILEPDDLKPPQFDEPFYTSDLITNNDVEHLLATVSAQDTDGTNPTITYSLPDPDNAECKFIYDCFLTLILINFVFSGPSCFEIKNNNEVYLKAQAKIPQQIILSRMLHVTVKVKGAE